MPVVYCVFAILYIAYLYIVLLLSVSCLVAVILLHCGASVQIPCMCKHTWPIKLMFFSPCAPRDPVSLSRLISNLVQVFPINYPRIVLYFKCCLLLVSFVHFRQYCVPCVPCFGVH